ncbi:MAG: FAD-binding oxidoreductase [Pseudomonadales bacterium]|nr:FAD-binding oxidoreductase [Pseudomonadales bacterium]
MDTGQHQHTVQGWGRFPVIKASILAPRDEPEASALLRREQGFNGISRGQGRSYGDSALASALIQSTYLDQFLAFDHDTGRLRCGSGITLGTILQTLLPRGWFLPVVPGTQFVSVGGAIACDVHGKNHHRDGSFCDYLLSLSLLLPGGEILDCSPTQHPDIFHATCSGMGLTGVILEATLQMTKVSGGLIEQRISRAGNLQASFELIEANSSAHYSVAWLDCMARGAQRGRSVLFTGEHITSEPSSKPEIRIRKYPALSVPFSLPSLLLNRYSIELFNRLYYARAGSITASQSIDYQQYFFPLDGIGHWNRLYGRKGFVQYQFVMPEDSALAGMTAVLKKINAAGKGSFLSVLKKMGPANNNLLSFPMAGYTLALDFKFEQQLLPLLDTLDAIVLDHGGRIYLAKDARMSSSTFKKSYPAWQQLDSLRERLGAKSVFNSMQSQRLGL